LGHRRSWVRPAYTQGGGVFCITERVGGCFIVRQEWWGIWWSWDETEVIVLRRRPYQKDQDWSIGISDSGSTLIGWYVLV